MGLSNYDKAEQAKAVLKELGYCVDNLWTIYDIKNKFNCTDEQAYAVLSQALHNEATVDQIQFAIDMHAEDAGLEKIVYKTKYFTICGYWKDTKREFTDYLVVDIEEPDEDEPEDENIFFYEMTKENIENHISLGEKTWLEFVITSYKTV